MGSEGSGLQIGNFFYISQCVPTVNHEYSSSGEKNKAFRILDT